MHVFFISDSDFKSLGNCSESKESFGMSWRHSTLSNRFWFEIIKEAAESWMKYSSKDDGWLTLNGTPKEKVHKQWLLVIDTAISLETHLSSHFSKMPKESQRRRSHGEARKQYERAFPLHPEDRHYLIIFWLVHHSFLQADHMSKIHSCQLELFDIYTLRILEMSAVNPARTNTCDNVMAAQVEGAFELPCWLWLLCSSYQRQSTHEKNHFRIKSTPKTHHHLCFSPTWLQLHKAQEVEKY